MKTTPVLLALTLAASALPAQLTRVIPTAAATGEGSTSTPYFSGYGAGRAQQVIDGAMLCRSTSLIRELALRADGANLVVVPGRNFAKLILTLGYTSVTPTSMSTTFASNRTGVQTTMFSGAYSLPAQNASTRPFNIVWKFASPFIYTRVKGNLLVEYEVPIQPIKSNYFLDAHRTSTSNGSCTPYGKAGVFKSPEIYQVSCTSPAALIPGGTATMIAASFTKQYPAAAIWGFSNSQWGAIQLPLDLTGIGAPGNFLNASMDLVLPMPLTPGRGGWEGRSALPIPNDTGLRGKTIYTQALLADPPSNAFGWVFSQGVAMTIAPTTVEAQLLGHYDFTSSTGSLGQAGTGMVMQFSGVFN